MDRKEELEMMQKVSKQEFTLLLEKAQTIAILNDVKALELFYNAGFSKGFRHGIDLFDRELKR